MVDPVVVTDPAVLGEEKPVAAPVADPAAPVLGADGKPVVAAPEGKPILDVEGKPVLDAEGKPTFEKPPEAKSEGAPEKYADFKMPEGATVNQDLLEQFKPIAKEMGLSQENAQKLIDLYSNNAMASIAKAQNDAWVQLKSGWLEAAKRDPEIGGATFASNCKVGEKAITQFGDQEFASLITGLGIGQNPSFIRFCVKVGKAIADDKLVVSGAAGDTPTVESILFPTMFSEGKK